MATTISARFARFGEIMITGIIVVIMLMAATTMTFGLEKRQELMDTNVSATREIDRKGKGDQKFGES